MNESMLALITGSKLKGGFFMSDLFSLIIKAKQKNELESILEINKYTYTFGLTLTEKEAMELYEHRNSCLKEQKRVEFEGGILELLIKEFCDSSYIFQDNYVEIIEALQEIFYLCKNESLDELSDEEIISFMRRHFEEECQGDLDYLEQLCLEELCRSVRSTRD